MTKEELTQRKLELERELSIINTKLDELNNSNSWRVYVKGGIRIDAILERDVWSVREALGHAVCYKKLSDKEFSEYKEKIKQLYL